MRRPVYCGHNNTARRKKRVEHILHFLPKILTSYSAKKNQLTLVLLCVSGRFGRGSASSAQSAKYALL
jgi:hypothetical protein